MEYYLQQFIVAVDPGPSEPYTTAIAETFGSAAENQTRLFSAAIAVPARLGFWAVQVRVDGQVDNGSIYGIEVVPPICPGARQQPNAEGVCLCRSPCAPANPLSARLRARAPVPAASSPCCSAHPCTLSTCSSP